MKQRIIIIGGMGPQASLELHRRMIQQALADGAKDGADFPHIVHLSLPVPDFIANESRRSEALKIIINELKNIDASMDDVIIIACNTAHLLQPDIEQRLNIRITSMVDAAIDYVSRHYKTIPQAALDKIPITTQYEQAKAVNYINNCPSSPPVLLGCTELSCAFAEKPNTIDPMNILLRYLTTKGVL